MRKHFPSVTQINPGGKKMSNSSIACDILINQDRTSKDRGKVVQMSGLTGNDLLANADAWREKEKSERRAREVFVKTLINDNATRTQDGLSLFVTDLHPSDKKLFLSYIVSIEEYEWLCSSPSLLQEAFADYEEEMQSLINKHLDDVWHDFLEDAHKHFYG